MPIKPVDWTGAWTFEDYVISLFEKKQMDSPEFKTLLSIFGRERIRKIWDEYKSRHQFKRAENEQE